MTHSKSGFTIVAGPCSAESEEQLFESAKRLRNHKICDVFRAGVWKPRTRPGSFEGFGLKAVKWMSQVKTQLSIPIATEAANAEQAEILLKNNFDIIWLGARTTVNPFLVQEISDVISGADVTILIKNPINADIKLWLGATERVLRASPAQVMAVHRGFQSYDEKLYRYSPRWDIAIQYMAAMPDVQLLCDPSHISGRRELIPDVMKKAIELGFAGVMVEVHPNPDMALSDKDQQITPEEFGEIIQKILPEVRQEAHDEAQVALERLRIMVDSLDEEMLTLLSRRLELVDQIGQFKKENNIPIFQPHHWEEVFDLRARIAVRLNMSPEFVEDIIQAIYKESMRRQTLIYQNNPYSGEDPRLDEMLKQLSANTY